MTSTVNDTFGQSSFRIATGSGWGRSTILGCCILLINSIDKLDGLASSLVLSISPGGQAYSVLVIKSTSTKYIRRANIYGVASIERSTDLVPQPLKASQRTAVEGTDLNSRVMDGYKMYSETIQNYSEKQKGDVVMATHIWPYSDPYELQPYIRS